LKALDRPERREEGLEKGEIGGGSVTSADQTLCSGGELKFGEGLEARERRNEEFRDVLLGVGRDEADVVDDEGGDGCGDDGEDGEELFCR
jgi:hypothetical protein